MSQVFKTSDQAFAAYLWCKGQVPIGAVHANEKDSRRKNFVFIDLSIDGDKAFKDFDNYQPDMISPKEFGQRWRALTVMAKEGMSKEEVERLRG